MLAPRQVSRQRKLLVVEGAVPAPTNSTGCFLGGGAMSARVPVDYRRLHKPCSRERTEETYRHPKADNDLDVPQAQPVFAPTETAIWPAIKAWESLS